MADKVFPTDFSEKATPSDEDKILLSDSADSGKLKYGKYSKFKWATWETGATGATWATGATGAKWDTWAQWPTGATWPQWPAWDDGNWIASITTNKVGKTTTVTITETDATVTNFDVEDWADGTGAWDFLADGTVSMTWDFNAWGNDITNVDNIQANSIQADWASSWVLLKNNAWTTVASFWVWWTSSTNIALVWATVVTGNISATNLSWTNTWDNSTNSSSMPAQPTTIELWHASDTTLSRSAAWVLAVEWVVIPSISSTDTLTNKRINPRVVSATSYTTDTGTSLTVATADIFVVTAQAWALKLNNPWGTPTNWHKLIVRIKDNWTARALTYDTQFRAMWTALPSTTVLSKTLYLGFIFNSDDTKRDLLAVWQEW